MNTYRTKKDIIKDARAELKKALPEWTFSLTQPHHASFHLNLMSGPYEALIPNGHWQNGYAQLNHYSLMEEGGYERYNGRNNGAELTPEAYEVMRRAVEIVNRENWDESDSMTDYFHCNYYLHVSIGKWDKPYQVKAS